MDVKLLWLTVVLLSSPLLTLCDPLLVMSAPNLLRVGSSENVFVEAQDYSGADLNVRISVKDFPKRTVEMLYKIVNLNESNNFQVLTDIKIPDDQNYFSDEPLKKQYVHLEARFPSHTLEKVVMVSFKPGYMFVQTDKPIYTPGSIVQYRIFSVTPDLKPPNKTSVTVEIMNPQDITVFSKDLQIRHGMMSTNYPIPVVTSLGSWKVVTRYTNTPQKKFITHFEVKEYVLPTFEVRLKPSKSFYYVDGNESLKVDIEAKYLFGKEVDGNAFVVFGVMDDEKKTSIPNSLKKVPIVKGAGTAELTRDMITKAFRDINQLVGQSIYVSVSLLTESGSEMVEAERRGIQIVTSPYTIHFKKTSQFFKPGMPFLALVYVTNPDGTPAKEVQVEVNPGGVKDQTNANGIARINVNTERGSSTLDITAKTKDPQLTEKQQATNKMTAKAYVTKDGSNNYLYIDIDASKPMKVTLNPGISPGFKNQDYTYMILSKSQIIQVGRFKRQGQTLVALSLPVSKEMVPSLRFVAYYHVGSSEVVSDSVWVDVKYTCMGTLKLEVKDKMNFYAPRDEVKLTITGDHGARVGLVAVDKAVHVLNKNRLTQSKIWDVIEKHDTGCTAGGGKDSMGVFTDAGLMFASNTAGGTDTRTEPECPAPAKRKRRAESLLQVTTSLAGQYSGELKRCCIDGMKNNKLGYTCERRATYIVDGPECTKVFLDCCNRMKTRKDMKTEEEEMILARSEDEDEDDMYENYDDIVTRTQFPESWLWEEVDLPESNKSETTSIPNKVIGLKDSITTWQILAVSLSPTLGICVAEPEEIVVFKPLFIDLKMPYSAVRGEQLEIKAIIHNYTPNILKKVRVEFMESADVCSASSKKGKYRTTVNIDKDSSTSVSYVIIPMTVDDHDIEVKAAAYDSGYSDGVKKTLKVVSEGLAKYKKKDVDLNPVKNGGKPLLVKADIPEDWMPDTPTDTHITVTGEEIAQTVEQAISGNFMGQLIVQPHGCGEQNMITMTLPLIATHYLDNTNQWEAVGMNRRIEAINHIQTGYERQRAYRKPDGSYAAWIDRPSSTWLTAYVAKVFAMANELISIDEDVICSALKWLVLNRQLSYGRFREDAPVFHGEMVGDIQGENAEASLTAFVVIAMQEGKEICGGSVGSLHESIRKAVGFLEGQLPKLTNPYAVALTSYAMANANKLNKDILMRHSTPSGDGRSWTVSREPYHSLEATAYAALALMKDKDYDKAEQAVNWMAKQRSPYGGYGTTQATIMVFQAVAEYREYVRDKENFNLDVELSMPKRKTPVTWTFKRDNVHFTRSEKFDLNEEFTVTATGTGKATLSVLTLYYARPVETDCTLFDLGVKMEQDTSQKDTYKLTMDFRYKGKSSATMTILDIGLLTGFTVERKDLQELSTGKEKYIQKFELDKVLSEQGSLILYLDKVLHEKTETISFRIKKDNNVGLLQPAAVTIYEYYSPNARCRRYYHPEKTDGTLYRLCKGNLCQCAEENCSFQRKNAVDASERANKACEPGMDYVYKVTLSGMDEKPDSIIYDMTVDQELKEGTHKNVEKQVVSFLARPNCKDHLKLEPGKSYLVMGKSRFLPVFKGRVQYIFGEHTWIEEWPEKDTNHDFSKFVENISKKGCQI